MKSLIVLLTSIFALSANAVPGTSSIECTSLPGAKVALRIEANAANVTGTESGFPSSVEIVYGKKSYQAKDDEGTLANLNFVNHALDRVVDVSFTSDNLCFEIWALPGTLTVQKGSDSLNGKAVFKAHATSYTDDPGFQESTLNCVFNYSGGSAG
jgi:hypothetical protein